MQRKHIHADSRPFFKSDQYLSSFSLGGVLTKFSSQILYLTNWKNHPKNIRYDT